MNFSFFRFRFHQFKTKIWRTHKQDFQEQKFFNVSTTKSQTKQSRIRFYTGVFLVTSGIFGYYLHNDPENFIYSQLVMPVLRLFNAETAHRLAILATKYHLTPRDLIEDEKILQVQVLNRTFSNPIGMAAGFDKHGECIDGLFEMGFGFVEIGSITPLPQEGNPKPRVFRLQEDNAIINRYGFNSVGLEVVSERLNQRNQKIGQKYSQKILGINLGKNKTSLDAASDYVEGVNQMAKYADYLVINISSPNTPGLRALQSREQLTQLIDKVLSARDALNNTNTFHSLPPLLLKIAPDLTEEDKQDIAKIALEKHLDGLIISNTTITRPETLKSTNKQESGGLSGTPLFPLSTSLLKEIYLLTEGKIPLIGVGGISNGEEAYEKIRNGASLVELYTAFSYQGPGLLPKIKRELAYLLKRDGFQSVQEVIGIEAKGKKK